MGIEVDVDLQNNKAAILAEMSERKRRALEAVGITAENNGVVEVNRAVYDTPPSPNYVRTGNLRQSITHAVQEDQQCVVIGCRIEYAPDVELGNSQMHARPFLRPAVVNYQNDYKDMFDAIMRGKG